MPTRRFTAASRHSTHSSSSARSYESSHTQDTALTSYSDYQQPRKDQYGACPPGQCLDEPLGRGDDSHARSSVETYASTIPSREDLCNAQQYEKNMAQPEKYSSDAIETTPSEFAELFPSSRRLLIQHDPSTSDGNMNLRVDTLVEGSRGRLYKMTLFHLKMQDLLERKTSLRRYCRESGREVCSSKRKYVKPEEPNRKRPTVQRSLTSTLQNLGSKAVRAPFRRTSSSPDSDENDVLADFTATQEKTSVPAENLIKLEFSNYAQVDIERKKVQGEKVYSFEYWGVKYYWRRSVQRRADGRSVSYHLVSRLTDEPVAHIAPDSLSKQESEKEIAMGGWCPPCSMRICDSTIWKEDKNDLADVIVGTGLMVLVDDSIRRHFHSKDRVQLHIPRKATAQYIQPGKLIDEVFHRKGYTAA